MTRRWTGPLRRALVVENPSDHLDEDLAAAGVAVRRLRETPDEDELIRQLQDFQANALFKRSRVPVTRRVVESCPELLVVQLCCIGDDSVDKQACADHGVMVFNDPVSNGRSVVELVIGNLISLSRRLFETSTGCREGEWAKNNTERFEVLGKRLGVLGLGNIGRGVARAAQALGMEIVFYDTRQVSAELGVELGWRKAESIEELFRCSDCVSVHLSARDIRGASNEAILHRERFLQLGADRPDGPRIFLNFSRGFLHTPEALIEAIEAGAIRRAAVDVYPKEPRVGDVWSNPYAACPKIAVFPHIGASTQEAQPRIARRVAETFVAFSRKGAVRDTPFRVRTALALSEAPEPGEALLMVLHSTARGTKRAVDEAIYEAGASNLASVHKDFNDLGFAYDLARLDKPLNDAEIDLLIKRAEELTGDPKAIRSVRILSSSLG